MFTGLVEAPGVVRALQPEGAGVRLVIAPDAAISDAETRIGDSVAINGCCLTVIDFVERAWTFQAGTETLSRTNLGNLRPGDVVNLERSLPANGRLGGHFVQGHIDGVGEVDAILHEGEWVTMWFRVPAALTRQMVSKGSVAVDGVSLTLVDVEKERFSVALIPHTLEVTALGRRKVGDPVNVETDIIGKYVEKLVSGPLAPRVE